MNSLVLTLIGPDRPGLVERVSDVVASHGGNWLESRMAHLAGQFAGKLDIAGVVHGRAAACFVLGEHNLVAVAAQHTNAGGVHLRQKGFLHTAAQKCNPPALTGCRL